MRQLLRIGVLALALAGCSESAADSAADERELRQYSAEGVCEEFVAGRLSSPATAEFSSTTSYGYDDQWTVRGAVDAQNGFGAVLRETYTCKVRYSGNEMWELKALTGLG